MEVLVNFPVISVVVDDAKITWETRKCGAHSYDTGAFKYHIDFCPVATSNNNSVMAIRNNSINVMEHSVPFCRIMMSLLHSSCSAPFPATCYRILHAAARHRISMKW